MSDLENGQETISGVEQPPMPPAATDNPLAYMFLSSFSHSLDSKSRVVIPSVYREGLGKDFVIAPSLDFESIAFYPKAVWEREVMKLYRKSKKNESVAGTVLAHFTTLSFPNQECDQQGRCLLPARAKQLYLGDAKEVVIAGKMDYVLVKSQEKAETMDKQFMLNKAELLRQLDMIED